MSNNVSLLTAAVVAVDFSPLLFAAESARLVLSCDSSSLLFLEELAREFAGFLLVRGDAEPWVGSTGSLGVAGFLRDGKLADGKVEGKLVEGKLVLVESDVELFPFKFGLVATSPLVLTDEEFGIIGFCPPICGFFAVLLPKLLLPNGGSGILDKPFDDGFVDAEG